MTFILINIIIVYFILAVSFAIIPYVTKKDLLFGVSIPASANKDEEIILLKRNHRNKIILFSVLIAAINTYLTLGTNIKEDTLNIIFAISLIITLIIYFVIYVISYREAKRIKNHKNWKVSKTSKIVIDTEFRKRKLSINPLWFLLYVAILIITIIIPIIMYDKLPDKLPIHFNSAGVADKWRSKDTAIMIAPISQLFLLIVIYIVNKVIIKAKQDITGLAPERRIEQNMIFRYRMSLFTFFSGLGIELIMLLMQLSAVELISNSLFIMILPLIITVTIIIGMVVVIISTGQSGWKIDDNKNEEDDIITKDDDKYWKLGSFYYNPNDPAIFIEKRYGIGWTCNFARPLSWIVIIGTIILIALMAFITS